MCSIPHISDEDKHDEICTLLLRFECLNKTIFESRFIPDYNQQWTNSSSKQTSFEEWPGTWGTQAEFMAAATLFQVPVYCCYTSLCGSKYHWEAINPTASTGNLRTLEIIKEDPAFYMQTSHHFQLLYWESTHFNCNFCYIITHSSQLFLNFLVLKYFIDLT